jgi:hypothetical protein
MRRYNLDIRWGQSLREWDSLCCSFGTGLSVWRWRWSTDVSPFVQSSLDNRSRHTLYPLSCSLKWCSMNMSGLYLFCFVFLPIEKGKSRQPLDLGWRHALPLSWRKKKTCLQIFIWHGLCSLALIRPFARPPLTLGVARWRCLCPRGMTAYSRAFNLAERVLLCSRMSNKLRCSCSDLFGQTQLKFLLPLRHKLVEIVCVLLPLWLNISLGSWCLSGMQTPCIRLCPLISSAEHMVRVRGWLLIPQEPSAVVRSPFISRPLLSFILALTSFTHLATFCQHPESSLASIVAICCHQSFSLPPLLRVRATWIN